MFWSAANYGQATAPEACSSGLCTQEFEYGTVYWKANLGAHGVSRKTTVGTKYFADGGYAKYGMPDWEMAEYQWIDSDPKTPLSNQQGFEKAIIVVPNGTAGFTLSRTQPIVRALQPLGNSYWGVQWLSPVKCGLAQGACTVQHVGYMNSVWPNALVQTYSVGSTVLGTIATGSPEWARWRTLGGESGLPGYPLRSTCQLPDTPGKCKTTFQRVNIYSAEKSTAVVKGAMLRWDGEGLNLGEYGAPLTDERCGLSQGGCRQEFARGTVMWTPKTGAQPVAGGIRSRWKALGAESAHLGYPTAHEQCFGLIFNNVDKSGCYQRFQYGMIWWSKTTGARAVWGSIMGTYQRSNFVWGDYNSSAYFGKSLGYPTSDENCSGPGGGCYQLFQNGMIWWSKTTGAQRVMGGDARVYQSLNWAWGRLGYPTTEEQPLLMGRTYPNNVWGSRQFFQRGYLTWHPRYGVTVTYR
ncbi:LGFP repeat-containing protein [Arthrobacter sp. RAF14]|uniref:LGFP repeat-containing protein n=1 Tax=Arthrobacter sp. RAF14 TaxID=3233051 RepID=UPI003F9107A1